MEVLVIDDFLRDPIGERKLAKKSEYNDIVHNGLEYKNISLTQDPTSVRKIERYVQTKIKESTVMYRYYSRGEEHSTFIHSDVLIGTFTGVLFLNLPEQCEGGIAFWEHNETGLAWHEGPDQLKRRGLENTDAFWRKIWIDGLDEGNWQMKEFIPMRFNRLVLFWSPRYHSRYPKDVPFGETVEDARLVKVFFLKAENDQTSNLR